MIEETSQPSGSIAIAEESSVVSECGSTDVFFHNLQSLNFTSVVLATQTFYNPVKKTKKQKTKNKKQNTKNKKQKTK